MKTLSSNFNWHTCRRTLYSVGLKEIPCMLLAVCGSSIGLSFLTHNPILELGIALGFSFGVEYMSENYLSSEKACCHQQKKILGLTKAGFAMAFIVGLSTWWVHGAVFHDDQIQHQDIRHAEEQISPAYVAKLNLNP